MVLLGFLWLFATAVSLNNASELPHGISHLQASFYDVLKPFTCLDKSRTIINFQVNDEYCDCQDGSDEPGTSACPNGRFHCRDIQYEAVSIPASLVNDGVCDCCDGSDEYKTSVRCESTCSALAAAVREARSVKRNEVVLGHQKFKEYVAGLKVRLEEERIAAEKAAEEEARVDAERKVEEAKAAEAAKVAEAEAKSSEPAQAEQVSSPESVQTGQTPPEGPVEAHSQPVDQQTEDRVEAVQIEPNSTDHHYDEEHDEYTTEDEEKPNEPEEYHPPPQPRVTPPPKPIDYGPEQGFRMLSDGDLCLEHTDKQYVYKLCAFREIHQRDQGESGNGVLLGRWGDWLHPEGDAAQKYTVMKYDDGSPCWNGPVRSVKVHIHCGPENKLFSVSEPSRCEYEMHIQTPAGCFEDPDVLLRRLHPEL